MGELSVSSGRIVRTTLASLMVGALVASCSPGSVSGGITIDDVVELPPEEDHQRKWEQIEEHKRVCMAEEGLEYVPYVQPRFTVNSSKAAVRGAVMTGDDRNWVETYGYGLTAGTIEENKWFDSNPNLQIRRALHRGEAEAYGEAFRRCAIEAQEEAGFDEHYLDMSGQISSLLAELETQILSDPRLAKATERWAACMNEKDHTYRRLSDPRDAIAERLYSIEQDLPEEAEVFYEDLLAEEIALAVDDLDCREESGVDEVLPEVVGEADADFVDRHRDLMEEYYAIRSSS